MGGESVVSKALGYAPPSAFARAAASLVLLVGFYLLLLGLAAALFAFPVAVIVVSSRISFYLLMLLVFCWVPAILLTMSAFSTRRPPFIPPRRRLSQAEAPALFAAVDQLAARAGTAPPTDIYLDCLPNLAVTEVGGVLSSRRVMIVGAPLLYLLSVDELRAGIAHELGHFFGGDTRLTTFSIQTHALFASVLDSVERDPFREGTQHIAIEGGFMLAQALGHALVKGYSHFYLRVTRPTSRRQELAADALSAALVSAPIAAAALEKAAIGSPLYIKYLEEEVGSTIRHGVMPTDLVAGFERLRRRLLATDVGKSFVQAVRSAPTETFDTHPALLDRLRALDQQPGVIEHPDDRPATALLADPVAFEAWLVEATRERLLGAAVANGVSITGTIRELPWARIAEEVHAPTALENARRLAERLHPLLPEATTLSSMFVAVWRRLQRAPDRELVLLVAPSLHDLPPREFHPHAQQVCLQVLETLLQGALLERGAQAQESLGEAALILQLGDERIDTNELLRSFTTDPSAGTAGFNRWAEQLGRP